MSAQEGFMRKRFLTLFVFFVFLFGVWGFQIQTTDAVQAGRALPKEFTQKVDKQVLDELSSKGKATFWIILKDKADLSSAFTIKKDRERGEFVVQSLKSVADKSQAGLRAFLATTGVKYFPFWIANAIQVRDAGAGLLKQIAARPEVDKIVPERVYELPKPTPGIQESTPTTTEWGLDNIQAPQVWSNFGVRGEGIVVANVDTGFQYDHPALVAKYRGNLGGGNFDHNYNWFDPSAVCPDPDVPCDNNSHGTHTMGTMVGDDGDPGTNQIGVAPHAEFMGCKGCETNSCSDFALNTCGQFILAPTDLNGNNPDPSKRPHIVNNSWGGGPGDPFYQPVVDAWVASGIFPQFSIGNSGPGCGSGGSPGDYLNSYGSGAYDINNVIAGFSGRGPSGIDGQELKPNIAAPGVNVRSSVPTNSYALFNGTSMASPHVAGTIALMWSAAPALVRDIAATRAILDSTATDVNDTSCGGTAADNNVWGEGRLNALEAVTQSPICDLGTLNGTVTDSGTSQPIEGALIEAVGGPANRETTTDANGNYSMDVCEATYDVTASAFGYLPETVNVAVTAGQTTTQDFQLDQAPTATVTGTVTDNSGHGWGLYARIDIDGAPNSPVFTNPSTGVYSVDLPEGSTFTFHVSAVVPGYFGQQRDVLPGQNPTEDFALDIDGGSCNAPGYGFGQSSPLFFDDFEGGFGNWSMDGLWNPENEGDTCGSLVAPFPSSSNDAYYGVDGVCNFDVGLTSGSLTKTAAISVPASGKATLTFWSYEQTECGGASCPYDARFVEVSTDGGSSWNFVGEGDTENQWYQKSIDLAAYSGQDILIRFRFDSVDGAVNQFFGWMVDDVDVSVTSCEVIPGGLIVGNVYDLNTGIGLNGAKVTSVDEPNDEATTFATPEDPNTDDGLYVLFSSLTGTHDFTASKNQYGSDTETVDVAAEDIVVQNFQLGTGHLVATPSELEATVDLGSQLTQQLTITNDGNADGTFEIQEGNGLVSFKMKGPKLPKAKAHKVDPKAKAKVGPTSVMSMRNAPKSKMKALFPDKGPNGGGWNQTSNMANPVIRYAHAQCDESPESYYVISGVDSGFGLANTLQRYDADTDTWTPLASYPNPSEAPTAVCFDGRIYVANGAFTSNEFFIYDIATDSWLQGAALPRFVEGGAMGAADGKIYLIGGDDNFQPADGVSNEVNIYDIATDTWTGTGATMPEGVSNAGMVQSGPFVYVVGGWNASSPGVNSTMTQRYDMSGDAWEVGPTFDLGSSDFALSATDTALYAAGGDANGGGFFDPSNAAQRLDLGSWPSGSWADLGSPLPEGRLANNAGFCTTAASGGEVWSTGGLNTSFSVDGKNMYFSTGEGCAGAGIDVPWISENPVTATVPANGGQVVVDVTYDASQVNQPGDYFAHLTIKTDTPYPAQKVNVTMHVPLPASFGILNGTVTGLGHCDAPGGPIEGATVFIDGQIEDFTLTTDENGFYTWALDSANSPVEITVTADGFVGETVSGVIITPQQTTTTDFELRLDAACLSVNPTELEADVPFGGQLTQQFTITNDGASDANFELTESNGLSFKFKHPRLPKAQPNKDAKGKTGPTSAMSLKNASKSKLKGLFPDKGPNGGAWVPGSPIPFGIIRYGHAQCEESPESFYIISGVDANFGLSAAVARYDADTDTWTSLANYPNPSEAPTAVCFEGRIYVANGAGTSNDFFIYDIATDSWLSGATLPRFVEGAAMGAIDGKVYLIGGDDDFFPGSGVSNEVNIYDVASDSWTGTGTPMPDGVAQGGSAQAGPFVYVVGGWGVSAPASNSTFTQRYDMSSDTWEVGPSFDLATADLGLSATEAALYAMGGDINGGGFFEGTDAVQRLDLSSWPSGSWADYDSLPSARQANSAGFCTTAFTGGEVWSDGGFFNFNTPLSDNIYHNTGEGCAGAVDVPWLSENPIEGTIPPDGGQQVIDVLYDAAQVQQPGDYFAHINVKGNSPGPTPKVNVTMHVAVPPNFGLLEGTVSGMGRCDVPGGPIPDATVFIDGPLQDFTVTADNNGHYQWYFDAANSPVDVTASAPGYLGATVTGVVITAGGTTTQDFNLRLDAPCGSVSPTSFDVSLGANQQQTLPLTIMNAGGGALDFTIGESSTFNDANMKVVVKNLRKKGPGAPLKEIKGNFSPLSVTAFKNANGGKLPKPMALKRGPNDAPWTDIAGYPGPIMDNTGAELNGLIYQVGGYDGGSILSSGNVYDPSTDSWAPIASMNSTREKPAAVAIDGLLYVTNGWDSSGLPNGTLEIYDPSTDSWTSGAPNPNPMGGGSAGVNFQGQFYVIGGCDSGSCGFTNVNVYDPATDSWSSRAGYPEPISWLACGDVNGQIVCAGGTAGNSTTANGYAYDSGTDSWSPIAPIPQDQWAMGYIASDGLLYISGGVTDGFNTITNEGFVYDPATDAWTAIENSNNTVYRGGSACGFYRIGGSVGGFSPVPQSEVYPGLTNCGGVSDLPWVSENPTSGTVPPDSSTVVDVTFDSTGLAEGVYTGSLIVRTNDPGIGLNGTDSSQVKIPLTLTVTSSCTYSNDFNDGVLEWIEERPAVTEPGDGFLHLTPVKRKAVGVAGSAFAGASTGTFTFDIQFSGGPTTKNWIYTHRVDRRHQMEILFKEEQDKIVVKERNTIVVKKQKADFTLMENVPYQVVVVYNGATYDVSVNGTPIITGFTPATLPSANIGAAAKGDTLLIDNVCVSTP
jgi:N-acetylneuraminic acid mutarotase